jgi:hypothetical protein
MEKLHAGDKITRMPAYWSRAHQWAKKNTRTFTLSKAIPSILALILQSRFDLQPRLLAAVGSVISAYLFTQLLHYLWNLLLRAPVALDAERQMEADSLNEQVRRLSTENAELKEPKLSPGEEATSNRANDALEEFDLHGRSLLTALMEREEWRHEELKDQMVNHHDFSDLNWSSALEKAKKSILVESIPPSPMRQYNAYRINSVYRSVLQELLHSDERGSHS